MKYSIAKMKAQEFANERQQPVYIAVAGKNGHCVVIFDERERPTRHTIIDTIYPETPTL